MKSLLLVAILTTILTTAVLNDEWDDFDFDNLSENEFEQLPECTKSCDLRATPRCRLPQVKSWCEDNCNGCRQ